jgi:hypothetical protein
LIPAPFELGANDNVNEINNKDNCHLLGPLCLLPSLPEDVRVIRLSAMVHEMEDSLPEEIGMVQH